MSSVRTYYLFGPCSGGAYFLETEGDEVRHFYRGDAAPPDHDSEPRESVASFLIRGADPEGYADERLADALAEIRASLDGWYRLPDGARMLFRAGVPREIARDVACGEVGRWNHRCSRACAGDVDLSDSLAWASRMAARPLRAGEVGDRDHPSDPHLGEAWAAVE